MRGAFAITMTGLIESLLGHTYAELTQGRVTLQTALDPLWIVAGIAGLGLLVWFLYRQTTVDVSRPLKLLLVALKTAALVLLFLCLLGPLLTTSTVVPQESYLGLLVDNSRSMTIRDMDDNQSRGEALAELLYGDAGLMERLQENFRIRVFSFDAGTRRIAGSDDLSLSGTRTSLAQSLESVAEELKGLPIAGLVLFTDGGDNSNEDPLRTAGVLKAQKIPVFTVGLGQETIAQDVEITQVSASRTVMEGSIFDVHVTVRSQNYEGRTVELRIEESGTVVASKQVRLEKNGVTKRHTLELTPEREGLLVYTVRIPELPDELIPQNNYRTFLVNNEQKQADILYIEGHPRNEYKFIRRAVEKDKTLRLATYLQTGPHKFLRQGIESPQELSEGYPTDPADLFRYEAIIFGDIAQRFFTADQLAMTEEFVATRGGGFLMLGGSTGFDEKYIGTPIADLLPVSLVPEQSLPPDLRGGARKGTHPAGMEFPLRLTGEGEQSAIMRLGRETETNRQLWNRMPTLVGINVTGRAKPGATVLAIHPALRYQNTPLPLIAQERYGRGRTMAITTASTWRWQMLLPSEDTSHERFWRQVLRWLTAGSPPPVVLTLDRETYSAGDEALVRVSVSDSGYAPINDATVWLTITSPSGIVEDRQLNWAIEEAGVYTVALAVQEEGIWHLTVSSTSTTRQLGQAASSFLVTGSHVEFTNAGMDARLLGSIAEAGNGKFYTSANAGQLVDDLEHLTNEYSVETAQDLWDIPLLWIALLTLFCLEWLTRRRKGLS